MNGFIFQDPFWLLAGVPLLLLLAWSLRRRRSAVVYSSASLLNDLPVTMAMRLKRKLPLLGFLGLGLCSVALARPQHGREEFRIRTEAVAIQIALDRSGSMDAMDFEVDGKPARRLNVAKRATEDFVSGTDELPGRPDDLVGLVSFGGFAESLCPLTLDHGALLKILEGVATPQAVRDASGRVLNESMLEEESQTAIGDAVALCVERLRSVKAKSKILILLSDGENTAGVVDPLDAAQAASEFGIKIYSIGIGSTGLALFQEEDAMGRKRLRSRPVRLDEELLNQLAEDTGGRYFNVRDTQTLEQVYGEIDKLEKTEVEGQVYTQYKELFPAVLLPGLFLLVLEVVLRTTRFRSLP